MKAKNEIERWLKDEKFMAFANKRAKEEFFNSENNYIDPQYEEMAEGFEDNDEYVVPMVVRGEKRSVSICGRSENE